MGSVASLLAMDGTTLTVALKPLERRGLVEVRVDPMDKRSRLMILTPEGQALLSSAVPIWEGRTRRSKVFSTMPILIAFETTFAQYPESLAQVFRLAGCLMPISVSASLLTSSNGGTRPSQVGGQGRGLVMGMRRRERFPRPVAENPRHDRHPDDQTHQPA